MASPCRTVSRLRRRDLPCLQSRGTVLMATSNRKRSNG